MSEKTVLGAEIFRERKYPFLGHLRKDEKVAALALTSMLTHFLFVPRELSLKASL
jgi:hypothetical protein